MSLWILQPDPNGNCCDCNGRTSPCDSCSTDCCFDVPYAFSSLEALETFLNTDMGGCNVYARPTNADSSRTEITQNTFDNEIQAYTQSSSLSATLAYSDSLIVTFAATQGQTVRFVGNNIISPEGIAPFHGWEVFLLSGSLVLDSRAGYGNGSFDFEYTATADGCFRILHSATNGFVSPPQVVGAQLSTNVQSTTTLTPMPIRAQYGGQYYAPSECEICGTGSNESLP